MLYIYLSIYLSSWPQFKIGLILLIFSKSTSEMCSLQIIIMKLALNGYFVLY